MNTLTLFCEEAQQVQATYASAHQREPRISDRQEYRTSLAKVIARAKECLEVEEYHRFLQEAGIASDVADMYVRLLTFFRYQETVVDPLEKKLHATLEDIQQILHTGINGHESTFDAFYELRCEAYRIANELDSLGHSKKGKALWKEELDSFFDRWYVNLPDDEIEWIGWSLD